MSLVSIFWVIWRKVMHTREAPDFGGYTKRWIARFLYIKEHSSKHPLKEHSCKFKIGKVTCSKSLFRATYDDSKNKPLLYP